jgi:hypothetical protein
MDDLGAARHCLNKKKRSANNGFAGRFFVVSDYTAADFSLPVNSAVVVIYKVIVSVQREMGDMTGE